MIPRCPAFDRISMARDPVTGLEAIQARFSGHAYDMHRHDEWLVGVKDHGVQDFFCRGARRQSTAERVILIEPEEMHDGQAGSSAGFSYTMVYLPQALVKGELVGTPGGEPGFRSTLADDARLGAAVRALSRQLHQRVDRLVQHAALDRTLGLLRPHLGRSSRPDTFKPDTAIARRARERLHDALSDDLGADRLAAEAGAADRFHLARAFRAAYGTSPHAYRVQVRLAEARRLLKAGTAPADVAAECGFADQSHFGRWFRRAYGITPAAYRALRTGVPDMGPPGR